MDSSLDRFARFGSPRRPGRVRSALLAIRDRPPRVRSSSIGPRHCVDREIPRESVSLAYFDAPRRLARGGEKKNSRASPAPDAGVRPRARRGAKARRASVGRHEHASLRECATERVGASEQCSRSARGSDRRESVPEAFCHARRARTFRTLFPATTRGRGARRPGARASGRWGRGPVRATRRRVASATRSESLAPTRAP